MGVGSGLMGFYRLHHLEVVTVDFLLAPLFMVIGGILMLVTAVFGFYVTYQVGRLYFGFC